MAIIFIINSILLGVGLAMDAFSVSMANGLREPGMNRRRMLLIAGTYAVFQFAMPMTGWICVHTVSQKFVAFQRWIPWIALILLLWIGGKMLREGIQAGKEERMARRGSAKAQCPEVPGQAADVSYWELFVQGVATSIDALSVGFTIAEYGAGAALMCSLIIAAVTLGICLAGLRLGRKFGELLRWRSAILGGVILIGIGLEIFF